LNLPFFAKFISKLTMFGECRTIIVKQKESLKGMLTLLNEYQSQPVTKLAKIPRL
jgi:hypothetical protein